MSPSAPGFFLFVFKDKMAINTSKWNEVTVKNLIFSYFSPRSKGILIQIVKTSVIAFPTSTIRMTFNLSHLLIILHVVIDLIHVDHYPYLFFPKIIFVYVCVHVCVLFSDSEMFIMP